MLKETLSSNHVYIYKAKDFFEKFATIVIAVATFLVDQIATIRIAIATIVG